MVKWKCLQNPEQKSVDVLITTVPWTDSGVPLMAPAVLKPIVKRAGMTCRAVDLNIEVFNATQAIQDRDDYLKFFFDGVCINDETMDWLRDLFESTAHQILSWRPKIVGLSLFSYACRSSTQWLCYHLKKMDPKIKIVLGGAGCLEQFTGPADFAQSLIAAGLADIHIRGDGEQSFFELLTGNTQYPGINDESWQQLDQQDIMRLPYPDYSDYVFELYPKKVIALQGSRGCVRKCTFCDYIANWTEFKWRTAEHIFEEMLGQYERYGIRTFKFQDTLTNGNLKEFNRLIGMLAAHNKSHPDRSLRWSGYYIFREKKNTDDREWALIKQSGADTLVVGIENLNQDIRYAIGKKFSNQSIDYHLGKALEHDINLMLLFIVGYVTETDDHIEFAKQWLRTHVQYQPIIIGMQWGGGLGIFPNTYIDHNKESLGVEMIGSSPHMWVNRSINSTPSQRAKWVLELNALGKQLGYNVMENLDNHFILEQNLNVIV